MDARAGAPSAASSDAAASLGRALLFDATERSFDVTGIEGRVPAWIRGSYYINGPARFTRGGRRYNHWLDGDGMVCALHFTQESVRFASRFVVTRKLADEEAAGAFLYRGFGTAFAGDRLRRNLMLESPVNVNVSAWGDRLLAFGEQSLPMELHPHSLATIGEFDFRGAINEVSPFAAHAKLDPQSGNLVNFGISYAASRPVLHLYEFEPAGHLLRRRRVPLDLPHSNHDFGLTARHAVFFLSPLTMDFTRFVGDRLSVMDSLDWQPALGSRIVVAPRRADAGAAFSLPAGAAYCLHLINAFERGTELTVDILEMETPVYPDYQPMPALFSVAPPCQPVRYVVDLATHTLRERRPMAYGLAADFPSIDARRLTSEYDDFWMLGISATGSSGPKFFDQLAHASWSHDGVGDVYRTPAGLLAGEPVFVGNPAEPGEGVVIVQHLDTARHRAAFLLFDAFAVHKGPIARLPLGGPLHPLFHASFHPAVSSA